MKFISSLLLVLLTTAVPTSALKGRQETVLTSQDPPAGSTTTPPSTTDKLPNGVAAAWYPGWMAAAVPPAQLPWSKYTVMTFAFALSTPDPNVLSIDDQNKATLPVFVAEAKKNNVKALLSLGGWTGSAHFSTIVATAESRTQLVNAILQLVKTYDLDGIDFDWEYPNKQGIGSNAIAPEDTANFLLLLQEIRKDPLGAAILLTAAVGLKPFNGPDGQPLADVSGFAQVVDYIAIMAYDIWGAWSASAGPNAPLADACAPNPLGSATSSVEAWLAAGIPANQLVLGVAAYGRAYTVSDASQIGNYPTFNAGMIPLGEFDTGTGPAPGNSGIFDFRGLIESGYLGADGTASPGYTYKFDDCSQTPFIYDAKTQAMISYDDPTSLAAKGKFISDKGLKGFAMWHALGDTNEGLLIDAVRGTAFQGGTTGGGGSSVQNPPANTPVDTGDNATNTTDTTTTTNNSPGVTTQDGMSDDDYNNLPFCEDGEPEFEEVNE